MSDIEQLVREALADAPASRLTMNDVRQPTMRSTTMPHRNRLTWSIAAAVAVVVGVVLAVALTRGLHSNSNGIGPAGRSPTNSPSAESFAKSPAADPLTQTRFFDATLGGPPPAYPIDDRGHIMTMPPGCTASVWTRWYTLYYSTDSKNRVNGLSTNAGSFINGTGVGSTEAQIRATYRDAREISTILTKDGYEVRVLTAGGHWIGFVSVSTDRFTAAYTVRIGTKDFVSNDQTCVPLSAKAVNR